MISKMHLVTGLCLLALGVFTLPAGCMAESDPTRGDNEAETVGEAEQAIIPHCGCGSPPCSCLGLCGDLNNWRDLGVPPAGECHETVNHYCANKGGNAGECWGWLEK